MAAFLKSMQGLFNDEIMGKGKLIRDLSKGNQKKVGHRGCPSARPSSFNPRRAVYRPRPTSQIRLKRMLNELQAARNMTMLISSHDLNHVTGGV